jgi:hypothetical protein
MSSTSNTTSTTSNFQAIFDAALKDYSTPRKLGKIYSISKQDARSLLSSLIIQLCRESDKYTKILSSRHSTHGNGSQQPS